MNKKQRWTGIIGIIVIVVMSLFPPYNGIALREGDNLTRFVGYYCIFFPPIPITVAEKMINKRLSKPLHAEVAARIDAQVETRVDIARWTIQTTTCIIIIVGVILLQGSRRR